MYSNLHILLRRQIKTSFKDVNSVPKNLEHFFYKINEAYENYDKELEASERILKNTSEELIQANKALDKNIANQKKEIVEKTKKIIRLTHNLNYAEQLVGVGNFTWNKSTNVITISENLSAIIGIKSSALKTDQFFKYFEKSVEIKDYIIQQQILSDNLFLEEVRLKNSEKIYTLQGKTVKHKYSKNKKFIYVIKDVTDDLLKEKELKSALASLENYKKALDSAAIVSTTNKSGIITHINDRFCKISGYSKEELLGKNHSILNSGFHKKSFFVSLWRTIAAGKTWTGVIKNKAKDGSNYWVASTIIPQFINEKIESYISIRFEITDKINVYQKVRDQKQFYEGILNNIPVDIAIFNKNHKYLFLNPIAVKNPEIRKFLIGKNDFDYCNKFNKDVSIAEKRREIFSNAVEKKIATEFIDELKNKDGTYEYHLRRFSPVFDKKNKLIYVIGFGLNITEKRKQEIALENSLIEKNALLGEVHHRVKNNLALVVGLVEMQISKTQLDVQKIQLTEVRNRIYAISMIHEKLYKADDFAKIEIGSYIRELANYLSRFFKISSTISVSFEMETVYMSNKSAVPIALIINEVITNSYKYAFKKNQEGQINISLKSQNGFIEIIVKDNGTGIPPEVNIQQTTSLGFKLINIFTKQLKAVNEINSLNGLTFKLIIPNEK